tara:strand:+ start:207 stop:1025 length:819 start_codon:yes stop_codon:yes gene_type:complete
MYYSNDIETNLKKFNKKLIKIHNDIRNSGKEFQTKSNIPPTIWFTNEEQTNFILHNDILNSVKNLLLESGITKLKFQKMVWFTNERLNINDSFAQPLRILHRYIEILVDIKPELLKKMQILRRPNKTPVYPQMYMLLDKNVKVYEECIETLEDLLSKLIQNKFKTFVKKLCFIRFHESIDDLHHKKLVRNYLSIKQNNKCAVCGTSLNEDCTYEHLKPRCQNGMVSFDNGIATHKNCNLYLGILDKNRKKRMIIENCDICDYYEERYNYNFF